MKFKPVVASLVVMGLMTPAFARTVVQQAVVDQNSVISTVCTDGWFNRISIGGIGSIVGMWGSHDLPGSFTKAHSSTDLFVNNANLLANAVLSPWAKFSLNMAYLGAPSEWFMDTASSSIAARVISHQIFADEAYITFADFAKYPVYGKIGKMYVPFGEYNDQYVPWQIKSPAQMLAQTNGPAAVLGVSADNGFYGSVFALKGETNPLGANANHIRNWGAKIGYHDNTAHHESSNMHVNVNVSYIHSVWDSLAFTPNLISPHFIFDTGSTMLRDAVGGVGAHAEFAYKNFNIYGDWVGTLKNMRDAYASPAADSFTGNSKFWGANVNAAYAFETFSHDSSLGAGFQFTGNGKWFAESLISKTTLATSNQFAAVIPKWRALVEYKISLCKHTDLGLVYAHGKSYDITTDTGMESRTSNIGLARLAVKF